MSSDILPFFLQSHPQTLYIYCVNIGSTLTGSHSSSHSCSLTCNQASWHNTQTAIRSMIGRNATTCHQYIIQFLWSKTAIWDTMALAFFISCVPRSIIPMNIYVITITSNLILKRTTSKPVIHCKHVITFNPPSSIWKTHEV